MAGCHSLHGAFALPANDNRPDVLAIIKSAFCRAGGKWASPRHGDKQCKSEPLYTPHIWAAYCLKYQGRVKRLIRGPVISITNPLRRRAKELWSVLRAAKATP